MFSNPVQSRYSIEEGTVIQVDPIRFLCKVKTTRGQLLHSVQWMITVGGATRSGDRFTPTMGDRVVLEFGLGYPLIIGCIPRMQTEDGANPVNIFTDTTSVDTGNYSPEGAVVWGDQNKPKDMTGGDRILTSSGGGFLALLKSGMAILKANKAAEITLSPIYNLVRIVSRNWEHFTDVCSDVVKNFNGKVYRYTGYAKTFLASKIEAYNLHFYFGDVKAAETIRTNYHNYTGVPASDNVIYKEQITGTLPAGPGGNGELMKRTLSLDGSEEVYLTNGEKFVRVTTKNDQLILSWNDECKVIVKEAEVHLIHKDGADVLMNSTGITSTFNAHTTTLETDKATITVGAGTVVVDNSQVVLTNGAGEVLITPALTRVKNGSHSISVTSTGIAVV